MKICGACKEIKPLDEFNRKGERYQSKCRECQRLWYKNYYDNSPVEKDRLTAKAEKEKAELRKIIIDAKAVPCADCGQQYPSYVMDFDHLRDKSFSIGNAAQRGWSKIKVLAEIEKCEVVCSNCHRERTHQRRLTAGVDDAILDQ